MSDPRQVWLDELLGRVHRSVANFEEVSGRAGNASANSDLSVPHIRLQGAIDAFLEEGGDPTEVQRALEGTAAGTYREARQEEARAKLEGALEAYARTFAEAEDVARAPYELRVALGQARDAFLSAGGSPEEAERLEAEWNQKSAPQRKARQELSRTAFVDALAEFSHAYLAASASEAEMQALQRKLDMAAHAYRDAGGDEAEISRLASASNERILADPGAAKAESWARLAKFVEEMTAAHAHDIGSDEYHREVQDDIDNAARAFRDAGGSEAEVARLVEAANARFAALKESEAHSDPQPKSTARSSARARALLDPSNEDAPTEWPDQQIDQVPQRRRH